MKKKVLLLLSCNFYAVFAASDIDELLEKSIINRDAKKFNQLIHTGPLAGVVLQAEKKKFLSLAESAAMLSEEKDKLNFSKRKRLKYGFVGMGLVAVALIYGGLRFYFLKDDVRSENETERNEGIGFAVADGGVVFGCLVAGANYLKAAFTNKAGNKFNNAQVIVNIIKEV